MPSATELLTRVRSPLKFWTTAAGEVMKRRRLRNPNSPGPNMKFEPKMNVFSKLLCGCALAALGAMSAGCASQPLEPQKNPYTNYVALGSSFAAGPVISTRSAGSPERCWRSKDNYAHQLARRRNLNLTDVTCSGAKSIHILERWNELPAQIDAISSATDLVTMTIGGNDLTYIGGLMDASCNHYRGQPKYSGTLQCQSRAGPTEADFASVKMRMTKIVEEVRRRAPDARIIFVDYATVLPPSGLCQLTPLTEPQAALARSTASKLKTITQDVASATGAEVLEASTITSDRHACSERPWMNGYPPPGTPMDGAPYHPNLQGMTAVAEALEDILWSDDLKGRAE